MHGSGGNNYRQTHTEMKSEEGAHGCKQFSSYDVNKTRQTNQKTNQSFSQVINHTKIEEIKANEESKDSQQPNTAGAFNLYSMPFVSDSIYQNSNGVKVIKRGEDRFRSLKRGKVTLRAVLDKNRRSSSYTPSKTMGQATSPREFRATQEVIGTN